MTRRRARRGGAAIVGSPGESTNLIPLARPGDVGCRILGPRPAGASPASAAGPKASGEPARCARAHVDQLTPFGYRLVVDQQTEETLRAVIARGPAAHFVAIFGSRAVGTARADSDLDLAWLPTDPNVSLADELALQAELTRAAGCDVDLVRLDRASTICRHEVARDGRLLAGSAASFTRFRAAAIGEFLDFEPALREATERFRRRWATGGKAGTP